MKKILNMSVLILLISCMSCGNGTKEQDASAASQQDQTVDVETCSLQNDERNPMTEADFAAYKPSPAGTIVMEERDEANHCVRYRYKTKGTCSQLIQFEIDDNQQIHNVSFYKGCNGNAKGIGILVEDMDVDEAIGKLEGVKCTSTKNETSCPDQLAKALRMATGK